MTLELDALSEQMCDVAVEQTGSSNCSEERRLKVFQNGVLRGFWT